MDEVFESDTKTDSVELSIPTELRSRPQWVGWWSVFGDGRRVILPNGRMTTKPLLRRDKVAVFAREMAPAFSFGSLLFRAHRGITRREKLETYQYARIVYEIFAHLRSRVRKVPSIKLHPIVDSPGGAAVKARQIIGAKAGPVGHLLDHLEWNGVLVLAMPPLKGRDAFSLRVDGTPVIAFSTGRSSEQIRLTCAHELGHLLLHPNKSVNHADDREADDFALQFLMSAAEFHRHAGSSTTLEKFGQLKIKWRVPMPALMRRARDLGLITDRRFRYLVGQIPAMGWVEHEPIDIPIEKPRMLRQMAESCDGHPIDLDRLADAVDLPVDMLERTLGDYDGPTQISRAKKFKSNVISLSERAKPGAT